MHNIGPWQR